MRGGILLKIVGAFRRCHAWCHAFLEISIDLACAQLSLRRWPGDEFTCQGLTQYPAIRDVFRDIISNITRRYIYVTIYKLYMLIQHDMTIYDPIAHQSTYTPKALGSKVISLRNF